VTSGREKYTKPQLENLKKETIYGTNV